MSIKEVKEMIRDERITEKDTIKHNIRDSFHKLECLYDRLDVLLRDDADRWEKEKAIKETVHAGENIYYNTLKFGLHLASDEEAFEGELRIESFIDDAYKISGNKKDGFTIFMPMLPRKFETIKVNQTRLMANIVHEITVNYLEKEGIQTPVYETATIHYEANFGPEKDGKLHVLDGDNIDVKHVTDALQQVLFPNDNLLTLSWKITGKRTDKTSFMRIEITGD